MEIIVEQGDILSSLNKLELLGRLTLRTKTRRKYNYKATHRKDNPAQRC